MKNLKYFYKQRHRWSFRIFSIDSSLVLSSQNTCKNFDKIFLKYLYSKNIELHDLGPFFS